MARSDFVPEDFCENPYGEQARLALEVGHLQRKVQKLKKKLKLRESEQVVNNYTTIFDESPILSSIEAKWQEDLSNFIYALHRDIETRREQETIDAIRKTGYVIFKKPVGLVDRKHCPAFATVYGRNQRHDFHDWYYYDPESEATIAYRCNGYAHD